MSHSSAARVFTCVHRSTRDTNLRPLVFCVCVGDVLHAYPLHSPGPTGASLCRRVESVSACTHVSVYPESIHAHTRVFAATRTRPALASPCNACLHAICMYVPTLPRPTRTSIRKCGVHTQSHHACVACARVPIHSPLRPLNLQMCIRTHGQHTHLLQINHACTPAAMVVLH